jgi:cation diffusion facilitator family transporter
MEKSYKNDIGRPGEGLRITAIGAVLNILLSAVKIAGGLLGHSRALVADGFHSLSDLSTDFVVALGLFYGARPRDADHPYGHKKIETVAEGVSGVILLAFAIWMAISAGQALFGGELIEPSYATLAIAFVSVASKEWLYRRTAELGRKLQSSALIVNAWHHRSDALTSLAALGAIGLAKIHPVLLVFDPLSCIGISVLVGKIGIDISYKAFRRLIDTAPEPEIIERIRAVASSNKKVLGLHNIRARYIGGQIIADLHIEVDPMLSVQEGHSIASEVEKAISAELGNIYDITVHVEPICSSQNGHP